jgi:hypothetical protein
MALRINTSRLNDSLQRMMSFYMQNKLGELSNQRYMDTIAEQDRLMRERQAESEMAAHRGRVDQFGLDLRKAAEEGIIKALSQPDIEGYPSLIKHYAYLGDTEKAKFYADQLEEKIKPSVALVIQSRTGQRPDPNTVEEAMMSADPKLVTDWIKEGGVQERFEKRLPIDQQQANTSAGNLALEREKFKVEQGAPGQVGMSDQKSYIDVIDKATSYLIGQGVVGESGGSALFSSGKVYDPMSSENRGKALMYLQEIKMQLIQRKPLSEPQKRFITQVWNIPKVEAEGLPSPETGLTQTETTTAETQINKNMEALITNQIMQKLGLTEDRRDYATQLAKEFMAGMK